MILVGLEDCASCKIAHGLLPNVEYVMLPKSKNSSGSTNESMMNIKRALGKLNPGGHFPVILNDDKTKIVLTDDLLNNLNQEKLNNILVNQ